MDPDGRQQSPTGGQPSIQRTADDSDCRFPERGRVRRRKGVTPMSAARRLRMHGD